MRPSGAAARGGARAILSAGGAGAPHHAGARRARRVAWTQAIGGRVAVCGQVAAFGDDPLIFVPFVSVLAPGAPHPIDRFVGTTPDSADQAYEAIVGYCYDGGGPVPALRPAPLPIPPLPNAPPSAPTAVPPAPPTSGAAVGPAAPVPGTAPTSAPAPPKPSPDAATLPASGAVTMRQDGNLHVAPHGETIRVLAAGTVLQVFGTAPGGWYEVGTGAAPEGWVHESMLAR